MALTAWGWWSEKGPFQTKKPIRETVDLLADVKYIEPNVTFERFVEFRNARHLIKGVPTSGNAFGGGQAISEELLQRMRVPAPDEPQRLNGEKIPSLPPFLREPRMIGATDDSRSEKEMREMAKIKQDCTNILAHAVLEEGFHLPPYYIRQQQTVSLMSYATMNATVRTYKADHMVLFEIELSIPVYVHSDVTKPTLLKVKHNSFSGLKKYIVEEEYAMKAIESTLKSDALTALRSTRSLDVIPLDTQQRLLPNAEGDQ